MNNGDWGDSGWDDTGWSTPRSGDLMGDPAPSAAPQPAPEPMPEPSSARRRRWPRITAYSVLGLVSLLVLGLTGVAWATYNSVNDAVHRSDAVHDSGVKTSLNGDTNILIMGLDTRLDENGNPLPQNIYDALHAGDGTQGGNNTNVLMLLHVPANGAQATEISIPRDDYVDLPGCPDKICKEKIKEAYGLAMDQETTALVKQGVPDSPAREQQERDAGRQEEMKTVSQFLGGVPIDHFVEVTLVAFYEIAQVVAPIPVCILYPTSDDFSGASFQAGPQELNAVQALAFVRQRRDYGVANNEKDYYTEHGLNFTDLDRERRQQAFIASLAFKLKQAGTITNPSTLSQILNVAEANIAVDSGLNLIQFAQQASNLTGGNVSFHTLPIKAYIDVGTPGHPNDVNEVDVPTVQADVRSLLGGSAGPAPSSSPAPTTAPTSSTPPPAAPVDVYNATTQDHLAKTVSDALTGKGFTAGTTGTDSARSTSVIEYGSGASSAASAVASALGGIRTEESSAAGPGRVRVILGKDFSMPAGLGSGGSTPSGPTAPPPSQPAPSNNGSNGSNDSDTNPMSSISGGGVPCVK